MSESNHADPTARADEPVATLSRRQALAAAGLMATSAGAVTAQAKGADSDDSGRTVGIAPPPANAVEFHARFVQTGASGEDFIAYGYLTRVEGIADGDLYAAGSLHNETTALFTAYAAGALVRRTQDQGVHSLDVEGSMTIYQRAAPGASFVLPDSFRTGATVARFEMSLQDILTVILPGKGIPTLNGAMRQTLADRLAGPHASRRFGRVGTQARLLATGIGTLVDPVAPGSILQMAGNWTMV